MSIYTDRIAVLESEFQAYQSQVQAQIETYIGQRSELQARIQSLIELEASQRSSLLFMEQQTMGRIAELQRLEETVTPVEEPPV